MEWELEDTSTPFWWETQVLPSLSYSSISLVSLQEVSTPQERVPQELVSQLLFWRIQTLERLSSKEELLFLPILVSAASMSSIRWTREIEPIFMRSWSNKLSPSQRQELLPLLMLEPLFWLLQTQSMVDTTRNWSHMRTSTFQLPCFPDSISSSFSSILLSQKKIWDWHSTLLQSIKSLLLLRRTPKKLMLKLWDPSSPMLRLSTQQSQLSFTTTSLLDMLRRESSREMEMKTWATPTSLQEPCLPSSEFLKPWLSSNSETLLSSKTSTRQSNWLTLVSRPCRTWTTRTKTRESLVSIVWPPYILIANNDQH